MNADKAKITDTTMELGDLTASPVYRENLEFWERAWAPATKPYMHLVDVPYLTWIPEYFKQRNAQSLLDLGCGSGWLSIYLARNGFSMTGVDIAAQALALGKMWADEEKHKIKFDAADIASLPYRDGEFDGVVANSIFEHLPYELARSTIGQVRRVLAPGGAFIGCFDKVGTGPGEYYKLSDGTHVYTDKPRRGMMLRYFTDDELRSFFDGWTIDRFETVESGTRVVFAHT